MKLNFRVLAIVSALICFFLAIIWIAAPDLLLKIWSVDSSYSTVLVARRGGALFSGLAIMLLKARRSEASASRAALASGLMVGCLSLAVLGLFEFFTGHAGIGILSAVIVEVILGLSFLRFTSSELR